MTKTNEKLTADQKFAEEIIEQLKAGTAPWVKPWAENEAFSRLPINAFSKVEYRGANILRLFTSAAQKGFNDSRWMTFKQASEHKMQVKKGSKGTQISFYKKVSMEKENADGDIEIKSYMACKTFTVFNAEQIDGIKPVEVPARKWQPIELGEQILDSSRAKIRYDGGNRAFYRPAEDVIHLPMRAQFATAAGFYGTACHELAHWTGTAGRLGRNIENSFGTEDYAKEELRAEIASWMLAVHTGLPFDPAEHTNYVAGWVKAIKDDYREIFRACADAQKIVDFLLMDTALSTSEDKHEGAAA